MDAVTQTSSRVEATVLLLNEDDFCRPAMLMLTLNRFSLLQWDLSGQTLP